MAPRPRFLLVTALVGALLPVAAALLARGIDEGSLPAVLAAGIAAALGILGLIGLARAVFVLERGRADR